MAMDHNLLEMWQGSQNQHATQKESCTENYQMTAIGYISETEEFVKTSWELIQHDSAAEFTLSETLPLPPALSTKALSGGQTQQLNVCQTRRINHHPAERNMGSSPGSIPDTDNWLDLNSHLDNPNNSEDDWNIDIESDKVVHNGIEEPDSPELQDVHAVPNVPGLIQPTLRSKNKVEKWLLTVNILNMRRNKGHKKK